MRIDKKILFRSKKLFLFFSLFSITTSYLFSQSVKNIEARVVDNKIHVGYTISGLKDYQEITKIEFYVSRDGGNSFIGPLKEISGDIGPNLKNGKYIMVWDALKEMPFTQEDLVFNVRLTVKELYHKKQFMLSYIGNMTTPFGLRVGQLGKVAWYVEVRSSLMPVTNASYTYDNNTISDFDKPGYYVFTGKEGIAAWSAIAGINFEVHPKVFLYVGGGYGREAYLYKIDEFDYESENKTGESWVEDKKTSVNGIEVDAGLTLKFGRLLLSGSATTISFQSFNWTAGVGIIIGKQVKTQE